MYYKVGNFYNMSFIYDSNDNSCEIVKNKVLKSSGLVVEKMSPVHQDINKIRTLYGFMQRNDFLYKDLFKYKLSTILYSGMEKYIVRIHMVLVCCLVPIKNVLSSWCRSLIDCNGYKDYIILMAVGVIGVDSDFVIKHDDLTIRPMCYWKNISIRDTKREFLSTGSYCAILSDYGDKIGINDLSAHSMVVPVQMLDYTIRLINSNKIGDLLNAYDGAFESFEIYYKKYRLKICSVMGEL